jgi:predicted HTH domain antitoxin
MGLTIPAEVIEQSNMSPAELLLEFAIFLYIREKLTLAQAARLSKLNRIAFQKELAKRKFAINLSAEDLKQELSLLQEIKNDYHKRHLSN